MAPNAVNKYGNVSLFFSLTGSCNLILAQKLKKKIRNNLFTTVDSSPETSTGMLGKVVLLFSLSVQSHFAYPHLVVKMGNYRFKISIQHKYSNCSRGNNNDSIYLFESSTNWYNSLDKIIIIITLTQSQS